VVIAAAEDNYWILCADLPAWAPRAAAPLGTTNVGYTDLRSGI